MLNITLIRKLLMTLTGLFLCFFLIIHLLGNLQLFLPADRGQPQFNYYSELLSGNILITIISYVLYLSLLGHAILALIITFKNKKAGGFYRPDKRARASAWESRNMGFLGTVILVFLIIHLANFWYVYKFGDIPLDLNGRKDLYTVVVKIFSIGWYVVVYSISMIALGYHLRHGVYSATRTLGVYHPRYVSLLKIIGLIYTYSITIGFIAIPIYVYLNQH
ncbi:MAG TPA: succinate dehydrogenase cytochrome b subunit [Pseudosphingobacterium sp.]|nr:succinate dehydrogenase cytochrome b subunit [Pseudosphingobacterium sp.]